MWGFCEVQKYKKKKKNVSRKSIKIYFKGENKNSKQTVINLFFYDSLQTSIFISTAHYSTISTITYSYYDGVLTSISLYCIVFFYILVFCYIINCTVMSTTFF